MRWERRNPPRYGPDSPRARKTTPIRKLRRYLKDRGMKVRDTGSGFGVEGTTQDVRMKGAIRRDGSSLSFHHTDLAPRADDQLVLPAPQRRLLEQCTLKTGELCWTGTTLSTRSLDDLMRLARFLAMPSDHPKRRSRLEKAARRQGGSALRRLLELDVHAGWEVMRLSPSGGEVHCPGTVRMEGTKAVAELRPRGMPADVGFGPEFHRVRTLWEGADPTIGDPDFDRTVRIAGPEAWWRAALDREVRAHVTTWVQRGVTLHDGVATWASNPAEHADLPALAQLLNRLARTDTTQLQARARDPGEPLDVCIGAARLLLADPATDVCSLPVGVLEGLLAHREHRLAAVHALGQVGRASSVGPIVAVTTGLFVAAELRDAGRSAVGAIEGRTGVRKGQLAVAPGGGRGGLSEADG